MIKMQNSFGQHVLAAEKGMALFNGKVYTRIYISNKDINQNDWIEIENSAVPIVDEITDTEALNIILGGAE